MRDRFLDPASRQLPGPGTRALVVGLGASGEAAARRLLALGARVIATDRADDDALRERAAGLRGVEVRLGREDPADLDGIDLVVAAPGVPPSSPVLSSAREHGLPVWGEVELAYRTARVPILGVTGTNGKTSTTGMIALVLQRAGRRAVAAGNIGLPLCDAAADDDADVIVAELSSFQLFSIVSFRPRTALLLNVAPDHLDWHGSLDAYSRAKARIFENQGREDAAVYHRECAGWAAGGRARRVPFWGGAPDGGAGVSDGWIVVPEGRVVQTSVLRGRGHPSLTNAVAAAATACAFLGGTSGVGDALAAFEPPPHRMEVVAEVGGVAFVNDSKATNPHAAASALQGIERAVLIAGGRNKGLDLSGLAAHAARLRACITLGEAAGEIEGALAPAGVPVERAASMEEAVERAAALARPGDTVLLSPACASFDMFADYRARGEAFRAAVKRLRSEEVQ